MKENSQKGFTLVELMIAMAIFSIVTAGIYKSFESQHTSYLIQEQVAGMQQNYRAAVTMISRDIRMAHCYLGQNGNISILSKSTAMQSGLRAFDNYAYAPSTDYKDDWDNGTDTGEGPDRLDIAYASVRSSAFVGEGMPKTSAELKLRPEDCNKFIEPDVVLISDGVNINLMEITHQSCQTDKVMLQHNPGSNTTEINKAGNPDFPAGGYPPGSIIFKLKYVSYAVDTVTDPAHPRLMVDLDGPPELGPRYVWMPLAHNIEDFQCRYIFADGTEADFPNETIGDPQEYNKVRAINYRILARSEQMVPGYKARAVKDRGGVNDIPSDGRIRRWYETTVKTRNMGLFPVQN